MSSADALKSEVHAATADASTSPTARRDAQTTRGQPREHAPWPSDHLVEPVLPPVKIIQDDTDFGGPLVIQSDDPDLNPPKVPIDPFPTDRTPEIDPPISDKR